MHEIWFYRWLKFLGYRPVLPYTFKNEFMTKFFKPHWLLLPALFLLLRVQACLGDNIQVNAGYVSFADSSISKELQNKLADSLISLKLHYPKSVVRLYIYRKFKPAWLNDRMNQQAIRQALSIIDSASRYGLSLADYHPTELHASLRRILNTSRKADVSLLARADVLLTDAVITLLNNLHFGKLNPYYPAGRIDVDTVGSFRAEQFLKTALPAADITGIIASVQPKASAYVSLARQLRLSNDASPDDSIGSPSAGARKIGVNLERLRWAETGDSVYIHINIPSFTLKLFVRDSVHLFKVIVGKPSAPTPELLSAISYFTTAPEWSVPSKIFRRELLPKIMKDPAFLENYHYSIYDLKGKYVEPTEASLRKVKINPANYFLRQSSGCDNSLGLLVFRFPNIYEVYLHDTPEKKLFALEKRAFSHGCIRVENAEKLARLLLINDGSAAKIPDLHKAILSYIRKDIRLNRPVRIKVTYLTTEVSDGKYVIYPDIYNLDKRLEMALYGGALH